MTQPVGPGYGQFTGYAPRPGGGFDFTLANGGTRTFAGPSAEELRKQIDASRGYQPGDATRAFAPPPQQQAAPGGPAPAPGPSQVNTLYTTKGGGQMALKAGGDPQNPLDWVVHEGPKAASKGGMAAKGMTTQGGYNVDEQFLDQMETSQVKLAAAQESGAQAAQQQAAARQGYFEAQKAQVEREQAVAAHEQAAKQKQLGDMQAKYDKAEQAFVGFGAEQEAKANSSGARVQTFVSSLSAALGALGASLARTPNFAAEAVERHNERELRKQEAELRVRKDSKDSLLGQLQQQMGSIDLARNAFRAIQSRQAALGWEQLASTESDANKQTTMLQAAEMQNQKYLQWREAYTRGAEGEVTRTFQYVPGSSGSRGGVRAPTLEEAQAAASLGKTYAETNKTNAAAQGDGRPHIGQRGQSQIVAARNARSAIQEYAAALGVGRDDEGHFKDPGLDSVAAAKTPYSDTRQKVNALKLTMIAEIGKAQTGGTLTEAEAHEMNEQLSKTNTPGEVGALLRHYDHAMAGVEQSVVDVARASRGNPDARDDEGDR